MMVGDGLNDAGALAKQCRNLHFWEWMFFTSLWCYLDASEFQKLNYFLKLSKNSYYQNGVLAFLIAQCNWDYRLRYGNLLPLPLVMPLSTITIVSFVTVMSSYYANKKI
jgi:Cu+-exporting ATPase